MTLKSHQTRLSNAVSVTQHSIRHIIQVVGVSLIARTRRGRGGRAALHEGWTQGAVYLY